MAYEFTTDRTEAERRLGEAMHIPGWPVSLEYGSSIDGERRATQIWAIALGITGGLRVERLLRATNAKIKAGRPDIGEGQITLVRARGNVLGLRVVAREVEVGIVFARNALDEVRRECPGALDEQRDYLTQAVQDGWRLGTVDESLIHAEGQRLHPAFVCSLSFNGIPGQPPATYLQTQGTTGHEHWITDPEVVAQHHAAYQRLAAIAVQF